MSYKEKLKQYTLKDYRVKHLQPWEISKFNNTFSCVGYNFSFTIKTYKQPHPNSIEFLLDMLVPIYIDYHNTFFDIKKIY